MPLLGLRGAGTGRLDGVGGLLLHLAHHLADLLGGLDRALGQLAHLVGDDGEAAAGLSGPGAASMAAFRASRLVWSAISSDHLQDLADLLRALAPGR